MSCKCPDPDSSLGQISWDMPDAVHCHREPLVSAPLYRGQNSKLGTFFKVLQPVSVHVHIYNLNQDPSDAKPSVSSPW